MCLASPHTALNMSERDHCIINIQVAVADRYIFIWLLVTVPSPSPFTSTWPATAGVLDTGPSVICIHRWSSWWGQVAWTWLFPFHHHHDWTFSLLPTYSVNSPSRLQVKDFSKSRCTCSTRDGGQRTMTPLTHATATTISPPIHAKHRHGSAFDCF